MLEHVDADRRADSRRTRSGTRRRKADDDHEALRRARDPDVPQLRFNICAVRNFYVGFKECDKYAQNARNRYTLRCAGSGSQRADKRVGHPGARLGDERNILSDFGFCAALIDDHRNRAADGDLTVACGDREGDEHHFHRQGRDDRNACGVDDDILSDFAEHRVFRGDGVHRAAHGRSAFVCTRADGCRDRIDLNVCFAGSILLVRAARADRGTFAYARGYRIGIEDEAHSRTHADLGGRYREGACDDAHRCVVGGFDRHIALGHDVHAAADEGIDRVEEEDHRERPCDGCLRVLPRAGDDAARNRLRVIVACGEEVEQIERADDFFGRDVDLDLVGITQFTGGGILFAVHADDAGIGLLALGGGKVGGIGKEPVEAGRILIVRHVKALFFCDELKAADVQIAVVADGGRNFVVRVNHGEACAHADRAAALGHGHTARAKREFGFIHCGNHDAAAVVEMHVFADCRGGNCAGNDHRQRAAEGNLAAAAAHRARDGLRAEVSPVCVVEVGGQCSRNRNSTAAG